jgi:hypothetical protein
MRKWKNNEITRSRTSALGLLSNGGKWIKASLGPFCDDDV